MISAVRLYPPGGNYLLWKGCLCPTIKATYVPELFCLIFLQKLKCQQKHANSFLYRNVCLSVWHSLCSCQFQFPESENYSRSNTSWTQSAENVFSIDHPMHEISVKSNCCSLPTTLNFRGLYKISGFIQIRIRKSSHRSRTFSAYSIKSWKSLDNNVEGNLCPIY